MQIIKSSEGLSKKDIYSLTRSPEIQRMSDIVGSVIQVAGYVIYEDDKEDGTVVTVLSVLGSDGTCAATNSATARREFEFILDLMAGETFSIKVISGTSKNGRTYLTLALA